MSVMPSLMPKVSDRLLVAEDCWSNIHTDSPPILKVINKDWRLRKASWKATGRHVRPETKRRNAQSPEAYLRDWSGALQSNVQT